MRFSYILRLSGTASLNFLGRKLMMPISTGVVTIIQLKRHLFYAKATATFAHIQKYLRDIITRATAMLKPTTVRQVADMDTLMAT
jgi:hypothetical protein